MKEAAGDDKNSSGGSGNIRNAAEKERTKMRERQRRSITTKIFHGLRKHGGYPLSPRADINQVLRHLAQEAGWIIEPDGTTYRSSSSTTTTTSNVCPLCGTTRKSGTPTPTSSFMGAMSGGGGGECSTTASPSRITTTLDTIREPNNTTTLNNFDHSLVATYMYGGSGGGEGGGGGPQHIPAAAGVVNQQGQGLASAPTSYLQLQWTEARASNQNTPAGTPQCRI